MTGYTRTELEALTREARLLNVARGAVCPLASALARSLRSVSLGQADGARPRASGWWDLLSAAWTCCHDAIDCGQDLEIDGFGDGWDVAQVVWFIQEEARR